MYTALTFKMNLQLEYQWILVVSRNIKTMKQVIYQSIPKYSLPLLYFSVFEAMFQQGNRRIVSGFLI